MNLKNSALHCCGSVVQKYVSPQKRQSTVVFFPAGLGGLGGGLGQFGGGPPSDSNQVDTSETVYISSLALLKMLKHGRAGVPMELDPSLNAFAKFLN
ncbi:hypothetical protein ANCDUO_04123 [Ancylostoma duodenale]|uniref:Uncharacterized protein n=1 Tax=Ancylostoma duodenale TaxID=51022 RepID=A0A0C2D7D6_9BILA|nr:hypothetical protein ANCDUO_04123 [Ancylostoma duodenale]